MTKNLISGAAELELKAEFEIVLKDINNYKYHLDLKEKALIV